MPSILWLLHSKLALVNCNGKHDIRIRLVPFFDRASAFDFENPSKRSCVIFILRLKAEMLSFDMQPVRHDLHHSLMQTEGHSFAKWLSLPVCGRTQHGLEILKQELESQHLYMFLGAACFCILSSNRTWVRLFC